MIDARAAIELYTCAIKNDATYIGRKFNLADAMEKAPIFPELTKTLQIINYIMK